MQWSRAGRLTTIGHWSFVIGHSVPRWLLVGLVTLAASMGSSVRAATPDRLVLALTPSKDPTVLQDVAEPLAQALGKSLGIPVKVYVASDYAGVVEALRSRTVDLAFAHPVAYVLASREANARVLVKSLRGGSAFYTARFFVLREAGIKSLEDLRGKRIAFVDPASTSGYIYPMVHLIKLGLVKGRDPKTFFKDAVFAGSHDAALFALLNRSVDAAVSYPHAPETLVKDPAKIAQLAFVAETAPIPNDGACVRDGLPADLVERIRSALLALNDPTTKPLLKRLYAIDGLAAADDHDYDPVRDAVDLLGLAVRRDRR